MDNPIISPDNPRNTTVTDLPVAKIEPNPYQPRTVFNEVALQELAASIQQHGVLQPVIVRPSGSGYQLVSGERRLQASRRANLSTIPAVIQSYDDRTVLEIAIVENVQREDISPLEAARAYKRLIEEFGLTQEQVALRVGKSRPAVSNTLRLLKLPKIIQQSLACGDITEGHARSLLSIQDPEWQMRAWEKIVQENLSVREAERLAYGNEPETPRAERRERGDVSREARERGAQGQSLSPELEALENRLRSLLGTRVRIRGTLDGGTVNIEYFDAQDLQRIAELLGLP
ncbi:MAG TPA: ParB/RepB/Spo0J family partition protein [Armatimonadota bacterium]|jgi:ParB family chromosome partitioning protein